MEKRGLIKLVDKFPDIAKEWHPTKNEDIDLGSVSYGSRMKVWWLGKCGHEYEMRIDQRTQPKRMSSCPTCKGKKTSHWQFLIRI
jgi:hypothetical protein